MKVSLDGLLKNSAAAVGGMWKHSLLELLENLRDLRQRTQSGDMAALEEFFTIYAVSTNKISSLKNAPKKTTLPRNIVALS